jgi:hypothetical protein
VIEISGKKDEPNSWIRGDKCDQISSKDSIAVRLPCGWCGLWDQGEVMTCELGFERKDPTRMAIAMNLDERHMIHTCVFKGALEVKKNVWYRIKKKKCETAGLQIKDCTCTARPDCWDIDVSNFGPFGRKVETFGRPRKTRSEQKSCLAECKSTHFGGPFRHQPSFHCSRHPIWFQVMQGTYKEVARHTHARPLPLSTRTCLWAVSFFYCCMAPQK